MPGACLAFVFVLQAEGLVNGNLFLAKKRPSQSPKCERNKSKEAALPNFLLNLRFLLVNKALTYLPSPKYTLNILKYP